MKSQYKHPKENIKSLASNKHTDGVSTLSSLLRKPQLLKPRPQAVKNIMNHINSKP